MTRMRQPTSRRSRQQARATATVCSGGPAAGTRPLRRNVPGAALSGSLRGPALGKLRNRRTRHRERHSPADGWPHSSHAGTRHRADMVCRRPPIPARVAGTALIARASLGILPGFNGRGMQDRRIGERCGSYGSRGQRRHPRGRFRHLCLWQCPRGARAPEAAQDSFLEAAPTRAQRVHKPLRVRIERVECQGFQCRPSCVVIVWFRT